MRKETLQENDYMVFVNHTPLMSVESNKVLKQFPCSLTLKITGSLFNKTKSQGSSDEKE